MAQNVAPVLLTATELEVSFGEQIILEKASLSIHEGDRIGLVGRNGAGKSTFLKILADEFEPADGNVAKRKDLVIGYLPQDFTLDTSKNVYQNIRDGVRDILDLLDKYEKLPAQSEQRPVLEQKIINIDGWNLETRINIAIQSLGVPDGDRDISTLSGGEKRRVALCRAIISRPDLLILDEPTNHLDTSSIEWIEDFMANYSGACLFVTHDRYFLDRIANRIVELSGGVFYSHNGNYTDYMINKMTREAVQESEEEKRQNFLRRELDWIRRGPRARRTKAKSRLDKYFEVSNQAGFEREMDVELLIPPAPRMGNKVLNIKDLGIELGGKTLFEHLNFRFESGRKLGIIGRNGLGKTTFLKIILGLIEQTNGEVEIGENTVFNYVDQNRLLLNEENTVLQEIGEGNDYISFGAERMTVWKYLRRFLFTDDRINTKVEQLSGGEKSRLLLAKILMRGGNFLILDEPTNDLDLSTLRILEEALIGFKGCVVVVSHDRYFLNRVCNGILAFEGNGNIHFSEGDYDFYLDKFKKRMSEKVEVKENVKKQDTRTKQAPRKLKYKEKLELDGIEEQIINAEEEVERIENIFVSPDFYEKYATQTNELNEQLEKAKKEVQQLYDRWEELEKIKNGDE